MLQTVITTNHPPIHTPSRKYTPLKKTPTLHKRGRTLLERRYIRHLRHMQPRHLGARSIPRTTSLETRTTITQTRAVQVRNCSICSCPQSQADMIYILCGPLDPSNQYPMGPSSSSRQQHQHYSTQAAKGKSRVAGPDPYYKPKGSKDKPRERDRRNEKDKPSSSRQNRPKPGKSQTEENYQQDDLSPFYKTTSSSQEHSGPDTANPDDSQPFEPTDIAASETASAYNDNYTTVPPISAEQQPAYDSTVFVLTHLSRLVLTLIQTLRPRRTRLRMAM